MGDPRGAYFAVRSRSVLPLSPSPEPARVDPGLPGSLESDRCRYCHPWPWRGEDEDWDTALQRKICQETHTLRASAGFAGSNGTQRRRSVLPNRALNNSARGLSLFERLGPLSGTAGDAQVIVQLLKEPGMDSIHRGYFGLPQCQDRFGVSPAPQEQTNRDDAPAHAGAVSQFPQLVDKPQQHLADHWAAAKKPCFHYSPNSCLIVFCIRCRSLCPVLPIGSFPSSCRIPTS